MDPHYIPLFDLNAKDREEYLSANVNDEATDLERDKKGTEDDTFDTESASYMDKEGVIVAERRTDYAPGQTGCGGNFSGEATKGQNRRC